jgi:hypothetical protein
MIRVALQCLALVLTTLPAWAGDAPPADETADAAIAAARADYEAGNAALRAAQAAEPGTMARAVLLGEAVERFLRADERAPHELAVKWALRSAELGDDPELAWLAADRADDRGLFPEMVAALRARFPHPEPEPEVPPPTPDPPRAAETPVPAPEPAGEAPPSDGGISPWWVAGGAAVTLAFAGVSAWSGVDALERHEDWKRDPTPANLDDGRAAQTRTNALVGVTAAFGVTTAVLAALADWNGAEPEANASVAIGVEPGGAGMVLRWTR